MKILLINPPIREWAKPNCVPLGLGYIAAVLEQEGHEIEVMDINAFRWTQVEVEGKIKNAEFDAVGIGGIVTVYRYVKWLISVIKRYHPQKKVIVGGSVATSVPKTLLERTAADIAVIGEGEETAKELFQALENNEADLSGVNGIWFEDENGEIHITPKRPPIMDLDTLPLPAWDLFPMDIYLRNPVGAPNRNKWADGNTVDNALSMNLSATRGCPYKCIYCYHDFMGQGYRTRSPQNVFSEMEILYQRYGVKYFHFVDDEFVMNKNFVYEFCETVRESGLGFTWACTGRVNLMSEELIATLVNSGCILIGYGIESGSQKMLDTMRKQVTVEQARRAIKLTQKYLGWADCSFMIGTPEETKETIQETVDFCKELDLVPEVIFFATPYPGTELYEIAKAQNKIGDEEEYILRLGEQGEQIMVNLTDFTDEELVQLQERMIQELGAWNKIKHSESR